MSGTRIDLDATRDQQGFDRAKIVIQDEETADKTNEPSPPSQTRASSSAKISILTDETGGERRPGPEHATIVNEEAGVPTSVLSATGAPPSSTRLIADAIRETIRKTNSSSRNRSETPSARMTREGVLPSGDRGRSRLPQNENNKPPDPSNKRSDKPAPKEGTGEENEDIDMMPKTEAEKHNYWKTRMQILKSKFPDVTIPKGANDISWGELRKIYYIELDRVSITKNVEMYKMAMVVMFFVLEYAGTTYLKIDVKGFAVHSMRSLHRYERLLIELGEKNYSSFADNWPVEFRLGGMVLVSAVIYCIAKYIFKLTGQDMSDDFFDLFNNLGNASVEADLPPGVGMDAPMEGTKGEGGLGGILNGLMGALGGGGGGGLGGILSGLMGGMGGTRSASAAATQPAAEEGSRIRPPTYRKKKKAPVTE